MMNIIAIVNNAGGPDILTFLIEQGTTAGLMLAILWILIKKVFSQYELRIDKLEITSEDCIADRKELHKTLLSMKDAHISALKKEG
jgi:uncharacterized protein YeeX (DUF496 family)|tara:strand:- start:10895 stop:11152 length:258 start_codon:yes stop_codon:yes gene_type:complete